MTAPQPPVTYTFPRGFLWGTATAAHQVEGNNTNNTWWQWEQQPGRIKEGHRSGLACDWWGGRWKEDMDRAAETHQNAHRFSVEWSRIQPAPDRWDEDALEMYRQMCAGMTRRGLMPVVTLHHFSEPLWLAEQGGWEDERTPELFGVFVRRVVEALKEYVTLWITINEPNVFAVSAYVMGDFPPGKHDLNTAMRVMVNLARAHAIAYTVIHEVQREARVGLSVNYRGFEPAHKGNPLDGWAATMQHRIFNDVFHRAAATGVVDMVLKKVKLPEAKGTQDYIGVQYYSTDLVAFTPFKPGELFARRYYRPGSELSGTGFLANEPQGLFGALKWAKGFGLPVIITENGVEDPTDILRPRYLVEHLHQVWRAVQFNWQIKGYFHWSLVDNFEWERGWTQRFGLWELDVESQARRKRPSVDLFAAICKENAISSEMVAKYASGSLGRLFPE